MDSAWFAAISAVGVSLITAFGAWLRARTNVRTAARLIYSELTRNSTAVAYFRQTGHWVAPPLSRSAWDSHGAVLARRRKSAPFETVHGGYEALELAPFLADGALAPAAQDQWLSGEADRLVAAIREIDAIARMGDERVERWTRRLEAGGPGVAGGAPPLALRNPGLISLALLDRLTETAVLPLLYEGPGVTLTAEGVQPISETAQVVARHVVFDARSGTEKEGLTPVRWTGMGPIGDAAADETYDALVTASRFMDEAYGVSLPSAGGTLTAIVHFGEDSAIGGWDGHSMVIGDGDGTIFNRYSVCLDVIAGQAYWSLSELGRFQGYFGEQGALTISVRDVLGLLTKQYAARQPAEEADWLVGEGLLGPTITGVALRSMKEPGTAYDDETLGKDPQVHHMDDYVRTGRDNGGIHTNSGIPNHAFYRLATALGGYAWGRAGRIWWLAITSDDLPENPGFADFARVAVRVAAIRYGDDGEEHRAVREAWHAVGVPTE